MKTDFIVKIEIDESGRLCITPEIQNFNLIWQAAKEVQWDEKRKYLYSPKLREWSYFDWFQHIASVAKEYGCELLLKGNTLWVNVPEILKAQILTQSTQST